MARLRALALLWLMGGCTGLLSEADSGVPDATAEAPQPDAGSPRDAAVSVDASQPLDAGRDAAGELPDAAPPPVPLIVSYTSSGATRGQNADLGALNIGNQFSVTREGVVLRELGVFDHGADGLVHPHTVTVFSLDRLGAGAVGTPVPSASVSVPAGSQAPLVDGFRFAPLPEPVALAPGFYAAIAYGLNGNDPYGEGGNLPASVSGVADAAYSAWQFVEADSPAYPTGGAGVALPSASFRFENGGPAPLRILCMGDSITEGYAGSDAGYRRMLHDQLEAAFVAHQLVGTATHNRGTLPADQCHHEGHSGWAIEAGSSGRQGLSDHVETWLGPGGAHPDVTLLMIGTNDVDIAYDLANAEERLDHLVAQLFALAPSMRLVLAKVVINGDPNKDANVLAYNEGVARVAGRHRDAGHDVRVVDMHAALAYPADFADGLHPNDQGYAKMAQVWLEALLAP